MATPDDAPLMGGAFAADELFHLRALSPLDGRYARQVEPLAAAWSEFAYLRDRVALERRYLLALAQSTRLTRSLSPAEIQMLEQAAFTEADAHRVKELERTTRHDVKAIEYFLRETFSGTSLADLIPWLHFGLTSEDINQLAQARALFESNERVILPALDGVLTRLAALARVSRSMPMLARTHGQPAVPTTLGKEFAVFLARLQKTRSALAAFRFEGKLTGAAGNLNALAAAAPDVDWVAFSREFVRGLGLEPNLATTQILPYDNWVRYFDLVRLTNSILLDLSQDAWRYIGDGYLVSRAVAGEIGSSTMPQKVNPIDFENAEGNLGLANALLTHYAAKLPVSRLQRDLSDSTVRRTFGVALGHTLVAYNSLMTGLDRLEANPAQMRADLEEAWPVVAEGAQTILRAAGLPQAYEELARLTRGRAFTGADYAAWVERLGVAEPVRARLRALEPLTYLGLAEQLVDQVLNNQF